MAEWKEANPPEAVGQESVGQESVDPVMKTYNGIEVNLTRLAKKLKLREISPELEKLTAAKLDEVPQLKEEMLKLRYTAALLCSRHFHQLLMKCSTPTCDFRNKYLQKLVKSGHNELPELVHKAKGKDFLETMKKDVGMPPAHARRFKREIKKSKADWRANFLCYNALQKTYEKAQELKGALEWFDYNKDKHGGIIFDGHDAQYVGGNNGWRHVAWEADQALRAIDDPKHVKIRPEGGWKGGRKKTSRGRRRKTKKRRGKRKRRRKSRRRRTRKR